MITASVLIKAVAGIEINLGSFLKIYIEIEIGVRVCVQSAVDDGLKWDMGMKSEPGLNN